MSAASSAPRRLGVVSSKSFEDVVTAFESAIGHVNPNDFQRAIASAKNSSEIESIVRGALGPSGFMEFVRFDQGAVLRREPGQEKRKIIRFLIGNPLVMKEMVVPVPEAGFYAPVSVLIDERADGVHLSYDRVAPALEPYGNSHALQVARDLDSRVEELLTRTIA